MDDHYSERLLAAEVTAISIKDLFPEAEFLGCHVSQIDFCCEFHIPQHVDENFIPIIEEKLKAVVKADIPVNRLEMMKHNGMDFLKHFGFSFRADAAAFCPYPTLPILEIGAHKDFIPELTKIKLKGSTGSLGCIKLLKIVNIEQRLIFQGVVQPNPQKLKQYVKQWSHFNHFTHSKLGKEMKLWETLDCGIAWLPRGATLLELIKQWWKKVFADHKFDLVSSSNIQKYDSSNKNCLIEAGEEDFTFAGSKRATHAKLFSALFSAQTVDLPVRMVEWGETFQLDQPPPLRGLLTGSINQIDEFHIFCLQEHLHQELISSLQFFDKTVKIFGFRSQWTLVAFRESNRVSTWKNWNKHKEALVKALQVCNFEYVEDQLTEAKRGPRVELRLFDPLGQAWPGPCIGFEEILSNKFAVQEKSPQIYMLEGTLLGSIEKFVALLLELNEGRLPFWLQPEQIKVLPLSERYYDYALGIKTQLAKLGYRVSIDASQAKLARRVHAAELEKTPYLAIVGDKEEKEGLVNLRSCFQKNKERRMSLDLFINELKMQEA